MPCTLEFIDSLQTVLLNGRPFKVEFGGLPKPVLVNNTKHFIRFSVLPRGFRPGHVRITGMRGEQPKSSVESSQKQGATALAPQLANLSVPPGLDLDSTSQDGMDAVSGSKPGERFVRKMFVP